MAFQTSKMVKCRNCGKEIAQEASRCPLCGAWNFSMINVVAIVVLVLLVLFFITGGFGGLIK